MKEKTLKFMSRYLLFGVITCMIGFGAASCGEDYDDAGIKSEMKSLKEALTALQAADVTIKQDVNTAVKDAVDQAKAAAVQAVTGMVNVEGATAADVTSALGQLVALQKYFAGSTSFATAVTTLDGLATELGTKAGSTDAMINAVKGFQTDIAMLKLQMDVLKINKDGNGVYTSSIIAELDGRVKTLEGMAGGDINGLITALTTNKTFMDEIKKQIGSVDPGLVTMDAGKMITTIAIVENNGNFGFNATLGQVDGTFFSNYDGFITFQKGKIRPEAAKRSFRIQVTPSHAVLTPNMISLVNSKGERTINEFFTVDVKPYTGLVTKADNTSTIASAGLYDVTMTLKADLFKEKKADFDRLSIASRKSDGKPNEYVTFAVAVENRVGEATEGRYVLTTFAHAVRADEYPSTYSTRDDNNTTGSATSENDDLLRVPIRFDVKVDDATTVSVDNIRNRYAMNNGMEAVWKTGSDRSNPNAGIDHSNPNNASSIESAGNGDARSMKDLLRVEIGKSFEVQPLLSSHLAYFVGLDLANATAEEATAWQKAGSIEGLNKIYTSGNANITVKDANLKDKEISFRVYMVNHDGTLVDPDGRSFSAICNPQATQGNTLVFETDITKHFNKGDKASTKAVNLTLPSNVSWSDVYGNELTVKITDELTYITSQSPTINQSQITLSKDLAAADNWAIGDNSIIINGIDPTKLEDNGKVYNGTFKLFNANGTTIASYVVALKKVIPVAAPSRIAMKLNGVTSGNVHPLGGVEYGYAIENATVGAVKVGVVKIIPQIAFLNGIAQFKFTENVMGALFAGYTQSAPIQPLEVPTAEKTYVGVSMRNLSTSMKFEKGQLTMDMSYDINKRYTSRLTYNYGKILYNSDADCVREWFSPAFEVQVSSVFDAYTLSNTTPVAGTVNGAPAFVTTASLSLNGSIPSSITVTGPFINKFANLETITGTLTKITSPVTTIPAANVEVVGFTKGFTTTGAAITPEVTPDTTHDQMIIKVKDGSVTSGSYTLSLTVKTIVGNMKIEGTISIP